MIETKLTTVQSVKQFFGQRQSYFLGILLGLTLIVTNVYIGLYMVNLLTGENYVPLLSGLSLPVIKLEDYEVLKEDYLQRQVRTPRTDVQVDPFRTIY